MIWPIAHIYDWMQPSIPLGNSRASSRTGQWRRFLLLFEEPFEVFSNSFRRGLLVFASASLFVDGICPQHFRGTDLDQLNRDIPLVLNPSTIGEQATRNLAAS